MKLRIVTLSLSLIVAGSLGESGALALGVAPTSRAQEADLEQLLERVGKQGSKVRKELLASCVAAAEATDAPQVELVRKWSEGLLGPIKKFPERTEFDAHDSREYKGGPPRKTIRPGRNLWDDLDARLERDMAEPRPRRERLVYYEYATGELVQRETAKALKARKKRDKRRKVATWEPGPEQPFRELLDGVLPGQSIAEEALIRALDALGSKRAEASFFEHLYCDREANAYEGISLFDMWSMPDELEVPDPDARAYAQLVWNDDSVPVPLSDRDHDFWYPRIETSYKDLRTHMFTTRAVAAVWFEGRPELSGGYANSIDIMNAAIALCDSDPERVAELFELYGPKFLVSVKAKIEANGYETWNAGNARRDEHAAGAERIRAAVLKVLQEAELR